MAFIEVETTIDRPADEMWDALRDWGALHTRLAPGFVTDTQLDGPDRIVTFFNGAVAREVLLSCDDDRRRLAWSIVDGPYTHHHGVAQIHADGDGTCRFVWSADVLPDEFAERTRQMMEAGIQAIRSPSDSTRSTIAAPPS